MYCTPYVRLLQHKRPSRLGPHEFAGSISVACKPLSGPEYGSRSIIYVCLYNSCAEFLLIGHSASPELSCSSIVEERGKKTNGELLCRFFESASSRGGSFLCPAGYG